ncbi:MAG: PD-(D/E)XK nuclease family protein [Bacteroidales bacterium]|nr:PD-(D/E)XK nuclease family protein [Bacteroidales bacterium]
MTQFLQTVAHHYFNPLPRKADGAVDYLRIADYMFVFPSRRSGLFFFQYLNELNQKQPMLAPQMVTIGDLFSLFSDIRVASRTELLFRLFRIYKEVKAEKMPEGKQRDESFEEFIFWGEMLLRDFDDVDKYLADARDVFLNVRDIKEIDERFKGFDEEFLKALRTFWSNVKPWETEHKPMKEAFVQTWEILYDVYSRFRSSLRKEGLAYEGMLQRTVVEQLKPGGLQEQLEALPARMVLVGITAINGAERELLKILQKTGKIEFCWDYGDERVRNFPFVRANLKDFPNALTPEEERAGFVPDGEKRIVQMAVPSAVGQAAEASAFLRQWVGAASWTQEQAIQTAVVLPDEKLLNAVLYAIPSDFGDYNVTMGYGLRSTSASALIDAIIYLQNNYFRRPGSDQGTFWYKAVLPLLSHAYLLHLEPETCANLHAFISRNGLFQVPEDKLNINCNTAALQHIFRPVDTVSETVSYLEGILKTLYFALKDENRPEAFALDRECLLHYLTLLDTLQKQVADAGVTDLHRNTFLHLLQKLAGGESVSFSGEPLSGLQVMGVLETRAVDFERIVMLSMNEGTIPAKPVQNTFIPNSLREAFGLPTQNYRDDVYAYHFYRLLARAREAVFLYDCRADGMQSGEPSRYLLQLKYLSDAKIEIRTPAAPISSEDPYVVSVRKDEQVMQKLSRFLKGGPKSLSASNLKTYLACPLEFYLAFVEGLDVSDELEDEMDDSRFGTILHATLERFYNRFEGQWVMDDALKKALDDGEELRRMVAELYNENNGDPGRSGYQQLVCELILSNVRSVLSHDRQVTPFRYLKSESRFNITYRVSDALEVNLKAIYDRLDIVRDKQGIESLRVVDYKTGNPKRGNSNKLQVGGIMQAFQDKGSCSKEAFQVMFYSLMLSLLSKEQMSALHLSSDELFGTLKVQPHLYFTREFVQEKDSTRTCLHYRPGEGDEAYGNLNGEEDMTDFGRYIQAFGDGLKKLIQEIFDPVTDFRQTADEQNCNYCKFRSICAKTNTKQNE